MPDPDFATHGEGDPVADASARAQRDEGTRVRAQEPPPDKPPSAASRSPRRGNLAKIENRLNEMFATVAMGQMAATLATGDNRHAAGADVTNSLSPSLVKAWVKLAETNPAVLKVLERMTETTAWGEVTIVSVGFVYSQAQAYRALPAELPNPWMDVPETVPPSPEVQREQEGGGMFGGIFGRQNGGSEVPADAPPGAAYGPVNPPPQSGVDSTSEAHRIAEEQRQRLEARRRERGT